MELVRVNEDIVLGIDDIQCVAWDVDMKKVKVLFKSNDNFFIQMIKKYSTLFVVAKSTQEKMSMK